MAPNGQLLRTVLCDRMLSAAARCGETFAPRGDYRHVAPRCKGCPFPPKYWPQVRAHSQYTVTVSDTFPYVCMSGIFQPPYYAPQPQDALFGGATVSDTFLCVCLSGTLPVYAPFPQPHTGILHRKCDGDRGLYTVIPALRHRGEVSVPVLFRGEF